MVIRDFEGVMVGRGERMDMEMIKETNINHVIVEFHDLCRMLVQ